MSHLVFYGGGCYDDNRILNKTLLSFAKGKKSQIAFIPASNFIGEEDFLLFIKEFKKYGNTKFLYFPLDREYSEAKKKKLLNSDIIFLGGGNTYYFLYWLRKTKMLNELIDFYHRGGVLAGLSAGGIILTPNIHSAGFPEFDKDPNEVNLKKLTAMSLVPFHFFPHYRESRRYKAALISESIRLRRPIYAAKDGSGIITNSDQISFLGRTVVYFNGNSLPLSVKL